MLQNTITSVEITALVNDRMNVQIKCPSLKKTLLRYCIFNTSNKPIRKGSFLGESVQLNLFHVPDGKYFFNLFDDQGLEFSLPFEKQAE